MRAHSELAGQPCVVRDLVERQHDVGDDEGRRRDPVECRARAEARAHATLLPAQSGSIAPGGSAVVDGVVDVGGHANVADAVESGVELAEHGAAVQADDEVVLLGVSAIGVESGRGAWKRARDNCRAVICKTELVAVRRERLARHATDDSAGAARAEVEGEGVAADDGGAAEHGEERAQDDHFERARLEQQHRRQAVVPPGGGHGAPAGADLDDVPSNRR